MLTDMDKDELRAIIREELERIKGVVYQDLADVLKSSGFGQNG